MRRFVGFVTVCLALALGLLMGTSSWAGFVVEEPFNAYHRVVADSGSFLTNGSFDVRVLNASGATLDPGAVVVLDTSSATCPATDFCVKTAPAAEKEKVIGVITVGTDDGLPVYMAVAGIFPVNVTGTVAAGDLLRVSSTVAGEAETAASGERGVFAIALVGGTDDFVWATFAKQEVY